MLYGDGTLGWPAHALFDAIVVAAGGPEVPETLKQQMAIGGRLVIPIGASTQAQKLVRVRRINKDEYIEEDLGNVRIFPLIGAAGWENDSTIHPAVKRTETNLPELIHKSSEHYAGIDHINLDSLLAHIGDSHLVLLGEASHGTAEFYDMRARITQELIEKKALLLWL